MKDNIPSNAPQCVPSTISAQVLKGVNIILLRKKEDEMRIRRRKKPCPQRGNRTKYL